MLKIITVGRFGNNLIQLINALSLAEKLNTPLVTFNFTHFKARVINIKVNEPTSKKIIEHTFYYQVKKRFPEYEKPSESDVERYKKYILPILDYELQPQYDYDNGLFIHIRSGDIFASNHPHQKYMQPPLDYYVKIINLESKKNANNKLGQPIYIFYEDDRNPTVNALKTLYPTAIFANLSMKKLIGTFLKVKYAVSGQGTLISSILKLNDKIERHYTCCPTAVCSKSLLVKLPDYITCWKNTKEQHDIMLSYNKTILPE